LGISFCDKKAGLSKINPSNISISSVISNYRSINYRKLPFIIYAPFYFCNLNLALFVGFLKAITNKQKTTWEATKRN